MTFDMPGLTRRHLLGASALAATTLLLAKVVSAPKVTAPL